MADLNKLFQRVQNKKPGLQRIAAARAAFSALTDAEKEELLEEWLAEMDTSEETATAVADATTTSGNANDGAAPFRRPVGTPGPGVSVVRDAITAVMRDGKPRGTTAILKAVQEQHPNVNIKSVPSAVARMVGMDPPLLIKRGKSERGKPLYIIPPTSTNGTP